MTEKRFVYRVFDIVDFKPEEFKLYEIDNNPSDDLDESNLFYVYSTSKANIEQLIERLNELTEKNEQLKIKNQKQENLINSQNKVIEELENWFDKWGFDVVNYRILDEIMEHFLGDD